MSTRKKPGNFIQRLSRTIWRFFNAITKAFVSWLLRSLLLLQRRSRLSQAGFVLPTVIMVILVVILLTTAIMIRSFDRSKNASNYRVNEAVLNAASPAIDRARSKLNELFSNASDLRGNTPSDDSIAYSFEKPKYTFGDETQIKLVYDVDKDNAIDRGSSSIPSAEQIKTAWKFPVDTDNNGKFDSFTLYGIVFRTPDTENRARTPLEARARPQSTGVSNDCTAGNGGGGNDAGDNPQGGWITTDGQLKKAFFTYVATLPITDTQYNQLKTSGYNNNRVSGAKFEPYKGNKGFSALEMQLDQARLNVDNNAVWYEDDLIITDVPQNGGFKLNGRVQANGNLMLGSKYGEIRFFQVSSPWSCFYNADNGKIVVGGNVSANGIAGTTDTTNFGNQNVKVDFFSNPQQNYTPNNNNQDVINDGNVTTTEAPSKVAYNPQAYAQRLNVLVQGGMSEYDQVRPNQPPTPNDVNQVTRFPDEIKKNFANKYPKNSPPALGEDEARNLLQQVIKTYFQERIRRVPFAEVPIDQPQLALGNPPKSGNRAFPNYVFAGATDPNGKIMAPKEWMQIEDANTHNPTAYTNLQLSYANPTMKLAQTNPEKLSSDDPEKFIGDRVLVGNGLPYQWWDEQKQDYATPGDGQKVLNGGTEIKWNEPPGEARERKSQTRILDDLGNTSRNGFWEKAAADPASLPDQSDQALAGGLRIITGAGIYADGKPILPGGTGGTGERMDISGVMINPLGKAGSFLPPPPVTPRQLSAVNSEIPKVSSFAKPVSVVWPDTMPMSYWKDRKVGGVVGTPEPQEVLKGDLQMRATVVYHYTNGDEPLACISSYYDPTNSDTAKNSITVDPTNGDAKGVSNNGISYDISNLVAQRANIDQRLKRQAYMVFPDGRWVNEPLKNAVEALQTDPDPNNLSLEQKAALDAANCALGILDKSRPSKPGPVPDGAIKEMAFLDARQVKTIHKPDYVFNPDGLTSNTNLAIDRQTTLPVNNTENVLIADPEQLKIATQYTLNASGLNKLSEYSLPIEQRQPLEIRVTEIDMEVLRTTPQGTKNGKTEYLLPLSGIIYASRDDALPDITGIDIASRRQRDNGASATDFKLDPSRRPNGIRLVSSGNNGGRLSRGNANDFNPDEKGLILASNLPVYIKGDFNRHFVFGGNDPTEEFQETLQDNYGNFYTRQGAKNRNFACRNGSKRGCNPGDQWRAARILADAVTLLSNNFRDGYRNEGDYDLNNNAGNFAVAARLDNGFWWNGFATNYVYRNQGGGIEPYPIDAYFNPAVGSSSYAMNNVTPIQRRVNFPEYKMEICRKLPVSECGPQDWKELGAGTTAANLNPTDTTNIRYVAPQDERFPRRVAFKRNPTFGLLELETSAPTAKPMGIVSNASQELTYGAGTSVPTPANNALWFWTTTDNANPSAGHSYGGGKLLYYLPDDPETVAAPAVPTERQLLLPGTPIFPPEIQALDPAFKDLTVLNGNTATDPSDYAVCTGSGNSGSPPPGVNQYQVNLAALSSGCPARGLITQMWKALSTKVTTNIASQSDPSVFVATVRSYDPAAPQKLEANAKVNFINLTTNVFSGNIQLSRGNQLDPIFVIRGGAAGNPITFNDGVKLTLDGVDPNNIFWVSNAGGLTMTGSTSQLAGNFIGGIGPLKIENGASIKGGRLLGFGSIAGGGGGRFASRRASSLAGQMTALTTTAQPLVVPVLQLHSPEGDPIDGDGAFKSSSKFPQYMKWLQRATATNYNASLIMGDTPARPFPASAGGGGENGGGLHNFPRFVENWVSSGGSVKATIKGSLIQYIKSQYATGPFDTVDLVQQDNSLFYDGTVPVYISATQPNVTKLGYQYPEGAADNKAPYYQPPGRNWGYDVGLLSQTPDLFSKRIAVPSAGTPNEFFREVGRDDAWIQTLLCAGEKKGTTYDWALADNKQRPNCPRTLADYTDPTT